MAENEEAARLAFNRYSPLHRGLVTGDGRGNYYGPFAKPIYPAAVAQAHLEGGRYGQEPPSLLCFDQHPKPAARG